MVEGVEVLSYRLLPDDAENAMVSLQPVTSHDRPEG